MKECKIIKEVRGMRTSDGAGVNLVRVLGHGDVKDFDPFLMLDSFDSTNPDDYTAGFPMHPHRGIETITYLIQGEIEHEDSLGNKDTIHAGEAQWMTAGSGILHQEMPQASERMLGFQLWLNLSADKKMTDPAYLSIEEGDIGLVDIDGARIRVLSGAYRNAKGVTPHYIPATIYDIAIEKSRTVDIPTIPGETAFVFLIEGDAIIDDRRIASKTAVLFGEGDHIVVKAPDEREVRAIFYSGKPLHEPISWGGPIVMNTKEELNFAYEELRRGTFIKHK